MADEDEGLETETEAEPKKRQMDLYTAMLLLSFIAISIGCILLALDLSKYEFQIAPPGDLKSNADLGP